MDLGHSSILPAQFRIIVDVGRLAPSCKTESRAAESKLGGLEISTKVAANWTYSKQSTQAVKANVIPMAPATMQNSSAIVKRNNARDAPEVDRGSRGSTHQNFSRNLITPRPMQPGYRANE